MDPTLKNKFASLKILEKIGGGSYGNIYRCWYYNTNSEVALKVEYRQKTKLQLEYKMYQKLDNAMGVPKVYSYGKEKYCNALIMELLGPSLEKLFQYCSRNFSMKTIIMLSDQMLRRIEYVHSKNYIHRDIKPDNFVMGIGNNSNIVFLIDFGLSKKYMASSTSSAYNSKKSLVGTAPYASIRSHVGIELSRRDDLESLAYIMVYFSLGKLPWHGITAMTKIERYEKIHEKKILTPIKVLCKNLHPLFGTYLNYCKNITYSEIPNYKAIREGFRTLFKSLDYTCDHVYDWMESKKKEKEKEKVIKKLCAEKVN